MLSSYFYFIFLGDLWDNITDSVSDVASGIWGFFINFWSSLVTPLWCILNSLLNYFVGFIGYVLPQTPPQYKLPALMASVNVPIIGSSIVFDVIQIGIFYLGLMALIKVWKLLPFT